MLEAALSDEIEENRLSRTLTPSGEDMAGLMLALRVCYCCTWFMMPAAVPDNTLLGHGRLAACSSHMLLLWYLVYGASSTRQHFIRLLFHLSPDNVQCSCFLWYHVPGMPFVLFVSLCCWF